ncbi:2-dehydro-3-deoxygluconokinase [Spinactinospora alkalitolerans]|uniref:2-dehydro-3-deoxygluconokinase n=1 Tax=Spinactinospora alkalitolerans TaxID=687207 RepID=A0A852TY09_9ACTN|nr:sugar kinase [Spinactinospora alkalitolerans]NYE48167.1 2-dehydro-3-deoxygluconokinase [Spinactinospora alkalitolerans]
MSTIPTRERRSGVLDAVCVGETMAMLTPVSAAPLAERPDLALEVGGAESNVACGLARLGHRVAWYSRVGDDPFGRMITGALAGNGVEVGGVEVDRDRPTGIYVKDPGPVGTTVYYYRKGSAASAMGPEHAGPAMPGPSRLVHLSGITPALSPSCSALVDRLLADRGPGGPLLSFDVNHRPALWSPGDAADRLLGLARAADVVFVGRDEAEALWATASADDVRTLLPDVGCLVVKDAEHGATCFEEARRVHVPAPVVTVVEPVGAGDAFAAGYLSGLLTGRTVRDRLRLGHLCAAVTLRCVGDLAPLPPATAVERLIALDDDVWVKEATAAAAAM